MSFPNYQMGQQSYVPPQQMQMQRLAQYEQQMQQQQMQQQQFQMQQQAQQQQMQPQPQVRPVTSIEEVRAISPNFDGSKQYFEDVTNNKMYIKYMDLNGLPITKVFSIDNTPPKENNISNVDYVSKEEFNSLRVKMEQYEGIIKQFIDGGSKDE